MADRAARQNLYQYVGNNPASYTDPFGLMPCEDENGEERPCKVVWLAEASNTDVDAELMATLQAIADRADVDLFLSSGRRPGACAPGISLHTCGRAADISKIGVGATVVDIGTADQANPAATGLVRQVQVAAIQEKGVRENFGSFGIYKNFNDGRGQILRANSFYSANPAAAALYSSHQNHIHISLQRLP